MSLNMAMTTLQQNNKTLAEDQDQHMVVIEDLKKQLQLAEQQNACLLEDKEKRDATINLNDSIVQNKEPINAPLELRNNNQNQTLDQKFENDLEADQNERTQSDDKSTNDSKQVTPMNNKKPISPLQNSITTTYQN